MKTLKDWIRLGGAMTLVLLGVIVIVFYRGEEFGLAIGIASIGVSLGFLWHIWNK